jgi:hypothetical protein
VLDVCSLSFASNVTTVTDLMLMPWQTGQSVSDVPALPLRHYRQVSLYLQPQVDVITKSGDACTAGVHDLDLDLEEDLALPCCKSSMVAGMSCCVSWHCLCKASCFEGVDVLHALRGQMYYTTH